MKTIILLLCLMCSTSASAQTPWWWYHKHKPENKIARMTPAQLVDELVEEHYHHLYDVLDEQDEIIKKYILLDGTKALPRIIEHLDKYDPSRPKGDTDPKYWRFEACLFLLEHMDVFYFRLRKTEEGRRTINALERSAERMRAAGFTDKDNRGNSVLTTVENEIKQEKGVNGKDEIIRDTFRFFYKIKFSEAELLDFSNYLTEHYLEYPSWSKNIHFRDYSQFNYAGNPLGGTTLRNPTRFHEALLEFENLKPRPDDKKATAALANVKTTAGQYEKEVALYNRLAKNAPEDFNAQRALGIAYLQNGNPAAAVAAFEKAVALKPGDYQCRQWLGIALATSGQTERALPMFEQTASGAPSFYFDLGMTLFYAEKFDDAIRFFELAVSQDASSIPAIYQLSLSRLLSGNTETAMREYEKLKKISPPDAEELLQRIVDVKKQK